MNAEIAGRSESGQKSLIGPSKNSGAEQAFRRCSPPFSARSPLCLHRYSLYCSGKGGTRRIRRAHDLGDPPKERSGDAISSDGDEEINGNFVLNGSTDDRESDPKNEEAPPSRPRGVGAASATHPIKTEDMSCENILRFPTRQDTPPTPKHFSLHA